MVARFGDEVTLKRFVRLDKRNVELRPESYKPAHKVMKLGLAKHILDIDRVAVGTMIGAVQDISVRGNLASEAEGRATGGRAAAEMSVMIVERMRAYNQRGRPRSLQY